MRVRNDYRRAPPACRGRGIVRPQPHVAWIQPAPLRRMSGSTELGNRQKGDHAAGVRTRFARKRLSGIRTGS